MQSKSHESMPWCLAYLDLIVLGSMSLLFLIASYFSDIHYGYISAPGGDLYNHVLMARDLQIHGISVFFAGYPRFFHLILLIGMRVTGLGALKFLLYFLPIVEVLVSLATGLVARSIAGKAAGVLTSFFLLCLSMQPWQTLYDGGFPDTLANGLFLSLFVACIVWYARDKQVKSLVGAIVSAFLVIATHHLSAAYLSILLFTLVIAYGIRRPVVLWLGALATLIFLATPISLPLRHLVETVIAVGGTFPWIHVTGQLDNPAAMWRVAEYPSAIGALVLFVGLVGLLFLARDIFKQENGWQGELLVLVWAVVLLIGSRIPALVFPVRLARDAGVPLSIAAGIAVVRIWQLIRNVPIAQGVLVIGLVILGYPQFQAKFHRLLYTYEPTIQFTPADQEALDFVGDDTATSIDRPLLTLDHPNVELQQVLNDHGGEDKGALQYNQEHLSKFHYVIYETDESLAWQDLQIIPAVDRAGFHRVAVFTDPLRTVIVFTNL